MCISVSGPQGPVGKAGLTEPAASDTAPEHLQVGPVVDDFRGGDNILCGVEGMVQIVHNALCYRLGCAVFGRAGF